MKFTFLLGGAEEQNFIKLLLLLISALHFSEAVWSICCLVQNRKNTQTAALFAATVLHFHSL